MAALPLLLAACSTVRETQPEETATEQLLMSTAADNAVSGLDHRIPSGTRVFVDTQYFESYDRGYVIGAIRAHLLQGGARLVRKRDQAEAVAEIRAGALSINRESDFIGLPSVPLPVPLSGSFDTPEVPLVRHKKQLGIAKIAVTTYHAETGALWADTGPVYGMAWVDGWNVLGIGWREDETMPPQPAQREPRDRRVPDPPASRTHDRE